MSEEIPTYTPGEVARMAGCRPNMIYNYIRNGMLPSVEEHGRIMVPQEAADTWLKRYLERKALRHAWKED